MDHDGYFIDNITDESVDVEKIVEIQMMIEAVRNAISKLNDETVASNTGPLGRMRKNPGYAGGYLFIRACSFSSTKNFTCIGRLRFMLSGIGVSLTHN